MPRKNITERTSPTLEQLSLWTRRLATLMKSGVSLVRCLAVLEDDPTNGALCEISRNLCTALQDGQTLSKAMEAFPDVFDEDYRGSIITGEYAGILDQTMLRWADVLERRIAFVAPAAEFPSRGQLAEWCWRFGHSWSAGVPTLTMTETLAKSVCRPLRAVSAEIDFEIAVGAALSEVMQRHPKVFPPVLVQMIAVSEGTGEVQNMLKQAAAHFDKEAAYEAAGFIPALWAKELGAGQEYGPRKVTHEHPTVRKSNEILAAAFRRGAQGVDIRPGNEGRGIAEIIVSGKPDQSIAIDEYDHVVRRFKIMAGMDPFTRETRTGPVHIRWEGKNFSVHVVSRPSAAGDRLFVSLRPAADLDVSAQEDAPSLAE